MKGNSRLARDQKLTHCTVSLAVRMILHLPLNRQLFNVHHAFSNCHSVLVILSSRFILDLVNKLLRLHRHIEDVCLLSVSYTSVAGEYDAMSESQAMQLL